MISAKVCRWYGGKKAALSLRFDDANTTHIEKAVPMLNECGLIGTFLVNPGNGSYKKHQSEWEGAVIAKGHELGDHTWNHRGAETDEEAEQQVGRTAEYLRSIQPEPKLKTFVSGGRTLWMQLSSSDTTCELRETLSQEREVAGGGGGGSSVDGVSRTI